MNWKLRSPLSAGTLLPFFLLFLPGGARADTYQITFMNVTFTATCIGGGTCTEVVNGSGTFDSNTATVSGLSISLTGTLNATLDGFGMPSCTGGGCFGSKSFYDLGAISGDPIEFSPTINNLTTTPTLDLSTTGLYIPTLCGGDVSGCGTMGTFPTGSDFIAVSGTLSVVDLTTTVPEPSSLLLLGTGLLGAGVLTFWRKRTGKLAV